MPRKQSTGAPCLCKDESQRDSFVLSSLHREEWLRSNAAPELRTPKPAVTPSCTAIRVAPWPKAQS
jgi:hypothetical protein